MLTIIFSHQWQANSLDVKSAFLQGNQIDRDLYLKPPEETNTGNLWKLKTTVYGLSDASTMWYLWVKEDCSRLVQKCVSMMRPYSTGEVKIFCKE